MYPCLRRVFTSLPVVLLAWVATNECLAAESMFESCKEDIEIYCRQVTPGNGRISACIYAHEDLISEDCDAATENFSAVLDWFLEMFRYTYDVCADDIQNYCFDTEFGGGRIISCLVENNWQVSEGCREAVSVVADHLE